jgi:flagellar biosynthesis anti-sigma factor FlgM
MRIDLNTRTPELSENNSASNQPTVRRSAPDGVSHEDQATLSSSARVASLATQVRQLPEIRETRVLALSRLIREGQYQANPDQIASSMFSEMMGSTMRR